MADSIAGAYADLAGIEIVNDSRTFAYLNAGLRPSTLEVHGDCGCASIRELVGCDLLPYSTPEGDDAPWYSPDIPESARFAGFLTTSFEGMESTFTRPVTERIRNGASLGRARLGSRTLTWRGLLLGADGCAVAYGLRWLTKTLALGGDCEDCNGDEMNLLVCCPPSSGTGSDVEAFRLLKNVALIEGPLILSERKTAGCGCDVEGCTNSNIVEIEFSVVSAQPYLYQTPIPLFDCINMADNASIPITDVLVECPDGDCGDQLLDDLCPPPVLPPIGAFTNPCFVDNSPYRSLYLTVPRNTWGALEEVVPVISITTLGERAEDIEIGFYTSANGDPCGDLINNPPLCDVFCDKLRILGVPPNSTFYIDGRTEKMSLICGPTSVFPGEQYTQGPWSWPSFRNLGFCIEFRFPEDSDTRSFENVCVSMSLVPRTF